MKYRDALTELIDPILRFSQVDCRTDRDVLMSLNAQDFRVFLLNFDENSTIQLELNLLNVRSFEYDNLLIRQSSHQDRQQSFRSVSMVLRRDDFHFRLTFFCFVILKRKRLFGLIFCYDRKTRHAMRWNWSFSHEKKKVTEKENFTKREKKTEMIINEHYSTKKRFSLSFYFFPKSNFVLLHVVFPFVVRNVLDLPSNVIVLFGVFLLLTPKKKTSTVFVVVFNSNDYRNWSRCEENSSKINFMFSTYQTFFGFG